MNTGRDRVHTDKKRKQNFPHTVYKEIAIKMKTRCAFPHILGSPSSFMTLQPLPSELTYHMRKIVFTFLSEQSHMLFLYEEMREYFVIYSMSTPLRNAKNLSFKYV
jgi:hypothetical protein